MLKRKKTIEYIMSYRSSLHYWNFERIFWLFSILVLIKTGWIYSTAVISVLSVYALYQNASTRVDQIKQKAKQLEMEGSNVGDSRDSEQAGERPKERGL